METQFVIDERGKKTAVIVPFEEWERTENAKEILEHIYLSEIIQERKDSEANVSLDELMKADGFTRGDLES
jgi:PHD/YefM family antitoxin component YafN of YafNO toxin-antitoxin module